MSNFGRRVVIDTNILLSALLVRDSLPDRVLQTVLDRHRLLLSGAVFDELDAVLSRPKFAKNISALKRTALMDRLSVGAEFIAITSHIDLCRDPRDNCFLELAVDGAADVLVSGDKDLLVLNPFGSVQIIDAKACLKLFDEREGFGQ